MNRELSARNLAIPSLGRKKPHTTSLLQAIERVGSLNTDSGWARSVIPLVAS